MIPSSQFEPLGSSLFPVTGRARCGTDFQPGGGRSEKCWMSLLLVRTMSRKVREILDVTLVGEDNEQEGQRNIGC